MIELDFAIKLVLIASVGIFSTFAWLFCGEMADQYGGKWFWYLLSTFATLALIGDAILIAWIMG